MIDIVAQVNNIAVIILLLCLNIASMKTKLFFLTTCLLTLVVANAQLRVGTIFKYGNSYQGSHKDVGLRFDWRTTVRSNLELDLFYRGRNVGLTSVSFFNDPEVGNGYADYKGLDVYRSLYQENVGVGLGISLKLSENLGVHFGVNGVYEMNEMANLHEFHFDDINGLSTVSTVETDVLGSFLGELKTGVNINMFRKRVRLFSGVSLYTKSERDRGLQGLDALLVSGVDRSSIAGFGASWYAGVSVRLYNVIKKSAAL